MRFERMLGLAVLFVRLERQDEVDEDEQREDQPLYEADEDLEPHERQRSPWNEQECAHDHEHDLATEHVAPETERQRQHPEELARELDQTDKQEDRPEHELQAAFLHETGHIHPAPYVGGAVRAEALGLIEPERQDREPG